MEVFLFCLSYLSITGEGILHLFFIGRFTKKKPSVGHYLLYLLSLYLLNGVTTAIQAGHLSVIWELIPLYLLGRLALQNRRSDSCAAAVLAVYIAQLSGGMMNSIEFLLFPKMVNAKILVYVVFLATLFGLALCLGCYLLILRWFSLAGGCKESCIWILLPPGLFLFAAQLYILQTSYTVVTSDSVALGKELAMLLLQLLSLGTLLSALYAWQRICRGFQAQEALALLKQETQAQKTYVAEARMRYEQTQAFRHDVKNHLSVLDGLLKSRRIGQAKDYLQKLQTTVKALSIPSQTGNPVVDILLADKLTLAEYRGIETELSIVLPQAGPVDDLDWCVLFSNALDNAIQANSSSIRITGERQGAFYLLSFENTCPFQPRLEIGTGLSNVKVVAGKYHGRMDIETEPENGGFVFRLHILLNCYNRSIHTENRS